MSRTASFTPGVMMVVLCSALAGCATREPEVRTVRVEVPVTVPCRTPVISVPAFAAADLKKADSLEVKVRALLAERRQRVGYEKELAAAAEACQ